MNKTVYRHLLTTYGRSPGVWVGIVCEFAKNLLVVIAPGLLMAQVAINVAKQDVDAALTNVVQLFFVNVAGHIIGAAGQLIAIRAENNQYERLTVNFYQKLTSKDMAFYRDNQTGYLASLFRQHLDGSMELARIFRTDVVKAIVTLPVPLIVLAFANWQVALVTSGIVLAQLAYMLWASAKANVYRIKAHEVYRKLTGEVADEVTNITAFKSSGNIQEGWNKIARLSKEETSVFWLRRKITTLFDLPRGLVTGAGLAAAFWVILKQSPNAPATFGLIVLTVTYMYNIISRVNDLPILVMHHDDVITKLHPTLQYLSDKFESVTDPESPKELRISEGSIKLSHVRYGYPNRTSVNETIPVFADLNLTINAREHVGVVGLSGAGKSTLANLLMRFDDIQAGSITIDGINIKNVRQDELRQNIAYVPQEPMLFHRSIRDNITYFNKSASSSDVYAAAKAAHIDEFIETLPDKYDTIVGERGVKLSGGQKQRVVIARAILKNAPIMIFDEATSALDSHSEEIIQKAIPEIISEHTALIIAHRLSTVARLDRIIVLDMGRIAEEGTHEELLSRQGRYHSLWQKQVSQQITGAG